MKKYIYILLLFAVITNWDTLSQFFGSSAGEYSVGDYANDKWYLGHNGYNEAIEISDQYEAPAIIYMYTDWCQYCKKFEAKLLTNYDVNASLDRFVKIKINPDISDKDKALYKKLKAKGFPTIMFKSGKNGRLIQVRAPYTKNGNTWKLMTANEFIAVLNKYGS